MEAMKGHVHTLVLIAVMAAVTCILAPLSIPVGVVPISLTNLVIYFTLYLLGWKNGTISYLVYMLIGFTGLPVFSGFTGGAAKLLGPTGGYIIGFVPMAVISGLCIERWSHSGIIQVLGMILGTMVAYLFGTVWLAYQAHYTFYQALSVGVFPFIAGDLVKIMLAAVFGPVIRKTLLRVKRMD